ncbi:2OG-Fe(II) oxygenase superfamily protein [Tricladium varicosporioides]|nr:2OG-Fe(II) oxygenase superfamily protein [Hymenoscyphus varicosporioides]
MPSAISKEHFPLPIWKRPASTTSQLLWADISVIDISTFDKPDGKENLAEQLRHAVQTTGFFSVVGTAAGGLRCDFGKGNYFEYRAANEKKVMGTEVKDNVESVNIAKFIPELASEPRHDFFNPYLAEIEDFSRRSLALASKIFTLFAIILELPLNYFSSKHDYSSKSEDHLRYMIYHPRLASEDALVENSWSRAHTDFGSLTLLWSQNVAGLQIKTKEGDWKYVPPVDGGIICNVGDAMQFWSAGYLKSTIHRVVRPPPDQDHIHRLGLFYFVRPGNEVDIAPAPSEFLKSLGLIKNGDKSQVRQKVTGLQYVRERVKNYHDHTDYEDRRGKIFKVGDLEIEDEAA